ncbi:hypothetical protein NSA19_12855 [Actinomyces bowdenii]|uniref:hypothetical protein n=1 Tax=Actinomyces bowdenii TaxID=131109 RepID=UPI00214B9710|nr:hypothetical protein [Actinomyces bowdenii]MCR2053710.1 hypothetical protein [Actinomyces bowdenii]
MAHNYYKDAVGRYATVTQAYLNDLSPAGANPCQKLCDAVSVENAWVSPVADDWVVTIGEIGTRIKTAFTGQDTAADSAFEDELPEVEDSAWQATWQDPGYIASTPEGTIDGAIIY